MSSVNVSVVRTNSVSKAEKHLFNSYVTMYSVTMKKMIGLTIIPYQHEMFRLARIKRCEEEISDEKEREHMIKYFEKYQFSIPTLDYTDFDDSECSIVQQMNRWVEGFLEDVAGFIVKDFEMNVDAKMDKLVITAKVPKIKDFCLTYIQAEKDGKFYESLVDCIHDYIHKHEEICMEKFCDSHERLTAVVQHIDVVEKKVVTKSKSQLKKEKAREANKRRDQEKIEKQKRQEKEAKYLEQKRKEAERKRIAVCRAKRK